MTTPFHVTDRGDPSSRSQALTGIVVPVTAFLSMAFVAVMVLFARSPAVPVFVYIALALVAGIIGTGGLLLPRLIRLSEDRQDIAEQAAQLRARIEALSDETWRLRENLERHRSVIDSVGDVVVRRDGQGRVVFVNDAFTRTFGIAAEAVEGGPLRLEVLEESKRETGRDGERLVRLDTVNGLRWFAWIDAPVPAPAGPPLLQSVIRDVTANMEAERILIAARDEARAASSAKSRFVAMVSHEIRTPLNGILGLTGLMLETSLTPEQQNYTRAVRTSGEALLSLIEDVLDFSKIEAGRLDLKPSETNIRTLVEGLAELVAPRAQAKNIEIATYVAPDVPATVMLDDTRLRQVLLNLVGNGIKFTEIGGVALEVTAEPSSDDTATRLRFVVRDSGIGMPPEHTARIFEEFEQADLGPSRRYGGTGLGLSISQRLVHLMGGEITVDSTHGAGSTFSFIIDVPAKELADARTGLAGLRVAVVSDARFEAPLMARTLRDLGADVTLMTDAVDAAGHAIGAPFDVVLIDTAVGGGAVAARHALHARGRASASIVLLAPIERGDLPRLKAEGFAGYLIKPVRSQSLERVVLRAHGDSHRAADAPMVAEEDAPEAYTPRRRLNVLLAEDNEINQMLTCAALKRLGHHCICVPNGDKAIARVRDAMSGAAPRIDVILMDLHMPGTDGFEATRYIRALEVERTARRVPILALTADAVSETEAVCRAIGADRHLVKPLDLDALGRAIDEAVAVSSRQ